MAIVHKNCRLAYGATRIVLLTARHAIKIPAIWSWRLFLLGLLANMQERLFSTMGKPELCPVLFGLPGGWLVVMSRAAPLSDAEWNEFDPDAWRDREDYTVPCEAKQDSFGWLDGRIVAVDYGN